jgi:sulfide:quinone oxidoreductase
MTALIELTDTLSMAGQIQPADVARLAASGYETIICNRPDDEEPHQPSMDSIEDACADAGVAFVRYPRQCVYIPR